MKNTTQLTVIAGKQEFFVEREFDAPRALVFRAFNEPELIAQWLGPNDMELVIEKYENKTGGAYRFYSTDPAGNTYAFNGTLHEVAAPERIIRTFEFEGMPERGHVSLEFLTLEELPGDRTRLLIQSVFKSVEDRDGLVQSGMEGGMNQGFVKLEALLEKMK